MSKKSEEVRKVLDVLYNDYASEVDISKITGAKLQKGIIVDFYIEDINCVIEVHGIQHEKAQSFGASKLEGLVQFNKQMDRDNKLRAICAQRDINYVEVWYNEPVSIKSIYDKLSEFAEVDNG